MSNPKPNDQPTATGRGPGGRFAKGNPGGPGNPLGGEMERHRWRFFREARAGDVVLALKTIREVMTTGKDADRLNAARLLLDRLIGPATALDLLARLEALEKRLLDSIPQDESLETEAPDGRE